MHHCIEMTTFVGMENGYDTTYVLLKKAKEVLRKDDKILLQRINHMVTQVSDLQHSCMLSNIFAINYWCDSDCKESGVLLGVIRSKGLWIL